MGKSDHERKGRGVIEKANECHHLILFGGGGWSNANRQEI